MKAPRTITAVMIAIFLFSACANEAAPERRGDAATQQEAALTRSVLTDAADSGKAYGQAHLGHYLHLNVRGLEQEGLDVPESITLTVHTNHDSFCVMAANDGLPSIHPWALASIRSDETEPSSEDRCRR